MTALKSLLYNFMNIVVIVVFIISCRYITRSQRTNESRSSPAIVAPITEQQTVTATSQQNQQEIQTISNSEITTITATVKSPTETTTNGHTIKTNGEEKPTALEREPVADDNIEIMTNNSGKKSKTTTATAAAAAATTATTNAKELKLISDDDTTTTATSKSSSISSTMAAANTTNVAVCSSTAGKDILFSFC